MCVYAFSTTFRIYPHLKGGKKETKHAKDRDDRRRVHFGWKIIKKKNNGKPAYPQKPSKTYGGGREFEERKTEQNCVCLDGPKITTQKSRKGMIFLCNFR